MNTKPTVLWSTEPIHEGMSLDEIKNHVRLLGTILKEHVQGDFILIRMWIRKPMPNMTLKGVYYQDSPLELAKDFLPTLECNFTLYFDGHIHRVVYEPFSGYSGPEDWIVEGAPNITDKMLEIEDLISDGDLTYLDIQREMSKRISKKISNWITDITVKSNGDRWVRLHANRIAYNGEVSLLVDDKGRVLDIQYDPLNIKHYYNSAVLTYT